ncbi:MAG: hypothetical protein JW757_01300 [Anaerolineales bacterium]|nr:hypothetical protein [Anaerolineales bacterium]
MQLFWDINFLIDSVLKKKVIGEVVGNKLGILWRNPKKLYTVDREFQIGLVVGSFPGGLIFAPFFEADLCWEIGVISLA